MVDAAGMLSYTADAGVVNNLRVSLLTNTYTFADTENIAVSGAGSGSFTGTGTPTVTGPKSAVSKITINWGNKSDTLTLGSFDASIAPLTATGGGGGADKVVIAASGAGATITGSISVTGFGSIQVNNQIQTTSGGTVTLAASGALSFMAAGIITSAGDVSLSSGIGSTLSGVTASGNLSVTTGGLLTLGDGTATPQNVSVGAGTVVLPRRG
jgi:hypothetical protein